MSKYNMEDILLAFSQKFCGNFEDVFLAIKNKVRLSDDEISKYLDGITYKHTTVVSEDYPEIFEHYSNCPPFVLYYDGNINLLDENINVLENPKNGERFFERVSFEKNNFDYIIACENQNDLQDIIRNLMNNLIDKISETHDGQEGKNKGLDMLLEWCDRNKTVMYDLKQKGIDLNRIENLLEQKDNSKKSIEYFDVDKKIENDVRKKCLENNYDMQFIMKASNHPEDNLYNVMAYRQNALNGYHYVVWTYNGRGLESGIYSETFKEAMANMLGKTYDVEYNQMMRYTVPQDESQERKELMEGRIYIDVFGMSLPYDIEERIEYLVSLKLRAERGKKVLDLYLSSDNYEGDIDDQTLDDLKNDTLFLANIGNHVPPIELEEFCDIDVEWIRPFIYDEIYRDEESYMEDMEEEL